MSADMDNFDFDRFLNTDLHPDEYLDPLTGSIHAVDYAMSGMSQSSQHNQSPALPIAASPEPKREESPGLFIASTPDPTTAPEDNMEEDTVAPNPTVGTQLASPIHFEPMPVERELSQAMDTNSQHDDSKSPEPRDPTPEAVNNDNRMSVSPSRDDNFGTQVEQLAVVDDDDDIIMISPEHASQEAQKRWSEPRESGIISVHAFVKQEPKASSPDPLPLPASQADLERMMAASQTLIQERVQKQKAAEASIFGSRPIEGESIHRRRPSFAQIGDEHDIANEAMQGEVNEEDLGWMNDGTAGNDEEYETLTTMRKGLEKKEMNGKITKAETLELYNIQMRLKSKDRVKRAVARALEIEARALENEEEEESLFVKDNTREEVVGRHIKNRPKTSTLQHDEPEDEYAGLNAMLAESHSREGLDGPGNAKATKGKGRKKGTGKRPANAREYRAQEDARLEKQRAKEQAKKSHPGGRGSKKAVPPTKGKGKGKGNAAANGKAAKKAGVASGSTATTLSTSLLRPEPGLVFGHGRQDKAVKIFLSELVLNDPINDRLQNPIFDVDDEPEIEGRQIKSSQFQRLFANIPAGVNKSTVRDEQRQLREASKSFGYAKVRAVGGKWLVKGMKSTLYHHQLLGAQWMVTRELSAQPPHGGLLADSMGLGKTVQTLACMVGNPPTAEDLERNVKATLIVVPAAVLDQWMDEIAFHTEAKVFRKVAKYKTTLQLSVAVLQDMDIVVTSYNEVMRQFPYPDKQARLEIEAIGYQRWWAQALESVGELHRVNWYRIVLDEAHAIKNNTARTSLACQNLKGVYRWCLTGTPLLNRLEELFPYLRFLKAHYSMDWQTFQKYFCDPNAAESQTRIATLLSYTMMRRTMSTTIMGRPIITLPEPHPVVKYINFSPEEQIIYRITENRFRSNINRYFEAGEVRKNYSVFMVQLLRLRQCTSHPFMLERIIKEAWTLEDVSELKIKLERLGARGARPFYEQTKVWVQESEEARAEAAARGEPVGPLLPFGRGTYGERFDMNKAIDTLDEKELHRRVNCGICGDFPDDPMETDCGHLFCKDCLETYMHEAVARDDEYMTCPSCDQIFTETHRREFPENDDNDAPNHRARKTKKQILPASSKGRDALGFEPAAESTWLTQSDNDENFPLAPSAKTAALKATLLKGFDEAPLDKVVIYVQFRLLARIVGRMCASEGWPFLYLSGDCSLEHRTKATKLFRDDPEVRILIAGLKCGGLGLNFPWANRCISLDLWWNHAVEQQAFGRIFRIGQSKETHMTRIVVKNSVDMRLLTMQIHKLKDLEKAVDGEMKDGLKLEQLANLFGFLRKDGDGEIVGVEADYVDGSESSQGGGEDRSEDGMDFD